MRTPRALTNPPEVEAAFEAVPREQVGEIIDGELHVSPRPALRHASATGALFGMLYAAFHRKHGGPGGWVILFEPELHLGKAPDKLVPDIGGWRRQRMPEIAPDIVGVTLAPDWVCEVLSKSTEKIDRSRKMAIYAREKVGHLWLANPVLQTLEVYRLDGDNWTLLDTHAGDVTVRAEPFEELELDLSLVWAL